MKTLFLTVVSALAVGAHDSYLMPAQFVVKPGTRLMVSLHNGDSFPNSEQPIDPSRIVEMQLSDKSPVTDFQILGRATHGFVTVSKPGSFYVSMYLRPKFIEMQPVKFEEYLREEGLLRVLETRAAGGKSEVPGRELYTKHAKTFVVSETPGSGFSTPVGHEIEFVPDTDPASLRPGSALKVTVLFRGKPLPDTQVKKEWASAGKAGDKVVGRTDSQGRITVPVESEGKWRLHVVHMVPSRDPAKADWESFWASLTFEVSSSVVTRR